MQESRTYSTPTFASSCYYCKEKLQAFFPFYVPDGKIGGVGAEQTPQDLGACDSAVRFRQAECLSYNYEESASDGRHRHSFRR